MKELYDYLNNTKYEKNYGVDKGESITPDTNKGYLDVDLLKKRLEELQSDGSLELEKEKADFPEEAKVHTASEEEISAFDDIDEHKKEIITATQSEDTGVQIERLDKFIEALESEKVFVKKYQYEESPTSQVLRFSFDKHTDLNKIIEQHNKRINFNIAEDLMGYLEDEMVKSILQKIGEESNKLNSMQNIKKQCSKVMKEVQKKHKDAQKSKDEETIKALDKHIEAMKTLDLYLKTHELYEVKELATKCQYGSESPTESLADASDGEVTTTSIALTEGHQALSKKINLTDVEKSVLSYGCEYLKSNSSNRVVLIDILERNLKTTILNGSEHTHTIVLFKNKEDKIWAIDPSNPQFSSHVKNLPNEGINVEYSNKKIIYGPPQASETGYAAGKFRDCIDVAVKLAFLLNTYDDEKLLDKPYESKIIQLVSNEDKVDDSIFYKKESCNRVKQSSDIQKIVNSFRAQEDFNKKYKMYRKDYDEISGKFKEQYVSKIDSAYDEGTARELCDINKLFLQEIHHAQTSDVMLLAEKIASLECTIDDLLM